MRNCCLWIYMYVAFHSISVMDCGPIRAVQNDLRNRNTTLQYYATLRSDSEIFFFNHTSDRLQHDYPGLVFYETNRACQYETATRGHGGVYVRPDEPCLRCICSDQGELCNTITCPPLPDSCIEVHRAPYQCCVTCLKQGCSFKNKTFHVGEFIQVTPCRTCKCETDGIAYCSVADCGPPKCVDHVQNIFECCPSCPRGSNCVAEGIIIPAGNLVFIPRRCKICRCLYDRGGRYWLGSKMAECSLLEECRNNPDVRRRLRRSSQRYANEYIKIIV